MDLRLMSLLGLVAFLAMAWGISLRRDRFPWRIVFSGMGLQLVLALFMLKTPVGEKIFSFAKTAVQKLLDAA
ncbi:MAG: Na+ dependent nucleoside transporter domain protein, partial [Verrucomicrobiales bacterium]|nr:Na+ dependent nucleoside transporter domain protein [Verrucomicrobiales bacterium]